MDPEDKGIGSSLLRNAPLSTEHPIYKSAAVQVSVQLQEIMRREETKRKTIRRMLNMVALDPEESAVVKVVFPDFQCVDYGSSRPGHRLYHVLRDLANEWCTLQVEKYTKSMAHIGGTAGIHLQAARHDVHIVGDCSDDVYAHALHESVLQATKMVRDIATVSRSLGRVVAPIAVGRFLKGETLNPCSAGRCCFHFREALVVDGSMVALSPHQVAAAMLQLKATVAYGFIPFSTAMLVSDSGKLDRSGIHFERVGIADNASMKLLYPEGRCGVESYPMAVWAAWVREQVITLQGTARDSHFQLELLHNKGPFMFYRMVRLAVPPVERPMMHALDLPQNADLYTVISWRIRHVGCDPRSESSWEKCSFTAEKRLVDRVYGFGMQLGSKEFTRFALRKQLKVVNDRVVVNGTAVTWHAPLTPDEIDQLSIALFSRLFVDRYDAGKLSSELMNRLRSYSEFHEASLWKKLSFITSLCFNTLWDSTLLHVDEKIREMCDAFHKFVNPSNADKVVEIYRPPIYLPMQTVSDTWFSHIKTTLLTRPSYPTSYVIAGMPGVLCKPKPPATGNPSFCSNAIYADTVDVPGILVTAMDADSMTAVDLTRREVNSTRGEVLSLISSLNEMDFEPVDRHVDLAITARRLQPEIPQKPDFTYDPDPVHTFSSVYERCFPGNSLTESQRDVASNALDPQDRNFSAAYLKLGYDRNAPKPVKVFRSRIKALNVTKRQDMITELVSATAARNMDPPVVSKPQDFEALLPDVWRRFKQIACRDDVDSLLAKFRDDPVAMGEEAFMQWMDQAKDSAVIERVSSMINKTAKSLEEYSVGDYLVMIKSDVKVPMSTKVQGERIEPQVIVYHDKVLSAGYSAIFRVLVTRFLALLKPNLHINLRKDTKDIAGFINALHPFELTDTGQSLSYLENDFSKYDKSQMELVFVLEKFLFEQLGMNQTFVDAWFLGHVDCKLRSLVHSFTLHVAWQRKSGDATTAFGNVILNCMSVLYAYPVSNIYWMVFMGDDSIICADRVSGYDEAIAVLAEVFNLQAKTYVTASPYFASNFIVINDRVRTVGLLPDPVKRVERWSMSVGELDANFDEKYQSARDVCELYRYKMYTEILCDMVSERYNISIGDVELLGSAIATVISDKLKFIALWEDETTLELS